MCQGQMSAMEQNKPLACFGQFEHFVLCPVGPANRGSEWGNPSLLCSLNCAQVLVASAPRRPSSSFLTWITGAECTKRGGKDEVTEVREFGLVEPYNHCQNLGFYIECDEFAKTIGNGEAGKVPCISSQPYFIHLSLTLPWFDHYVLCRVRKLETFVLSL